jgi:hypothetical protein
MNPEEKYKHIQIIDNCISPEISSRFEEMFLPLSGRDYIKGPYDLPPHVEYRYTSKIAGNTFSPGMSKQFSDLDENIHDTFEYLCLNVLYSAVHKFNIMVHNVIQSRTFIHLPSSFPGLDDIHTDLPFEHLVFIYYINDSDGDTVFFKDDKKTEIKRVTPKKGRGVIFDGVINHCSTRPSKHSRGIINFNFLGEKF